MIIDINNVIQLYLSFVKPNIVFSIHMLDVKIITFIYKIVLRSYYLSYLTDFLLTIII